MVAGWGFAAAGVAIALLWLFGRHGLSPVQAHVRAESFWWPLVETVVGLLTVGGLALVVRRRKMSQTPGSRWPHWGRAGALVLLACVTGALIAAGAPLLVIEHDLSGTDTGGDDVAEDCRNIAGRFRHTGMRRGPVVAWHSPRHEHRLRGDRASRLRPDHSEHLLSAGRQAQAEVQVPIRGLCLVRDPDGRRGEALRRLVRPRTTGIPRTGRCRFRSHRGRRGGVPNSGGGASDVDPGGRRSPACIECARHPGHGQQFEPVPVEADHRGSPPPRCSACV